MEIVIDPCGTAMCIYCEDIDLAQLGEVDVSRASWVEPDDHGQWWADLSPVNGPTLGPFHRRSAALDAEVQWLRSNVLGVTGLKEDS
jgi:hypothetical protein